MATMYLQLDYEEYKAFEAAIKSGANKLEKTAGQGKYYHKYFRLPFSSELALEVHGPLVKAG